MKYTIVLVAILISSMASCQSKSSKKTPDEVKETFKRMYPGENDPDWHLDKNNNYESHFKIKGKHYRADYKASGQWIETESSIKKSDLPKKIRKKIKSDFDTYKIVEIEEVDHYAKGRFYDVEFKIDGKKKDIEFDKDGNIIN